MKAKEKTKTLVHWRCFECGASGWEAETYYACDMLDELRRAHTHPNGIRVGERKVAALRAEP